MVERAHLQITRRFAKGSPNDLFFEWFKQTFRNYSDLTTNAAKDKYWPVYLASTGASPEAVAQAKRQAIHAFGAELDSLLGDIAPMSSPPVVETQDQPIDEFEVEETYDDD